MRIPPPHVSPQLLAPHSAHVSRYQTCLLFIVLLRRNGERLWRLREPRSSFPSRRACRAARLQSQTNRELFDQPIRGGMALGTAALAGAAGPPPPTIALRRFRLPHATSMAKQSSRGCRSRLQTCSSRLGLAPAPPPLPPSISQAERGVQHQLNNSVPFPSAKKVSGNSSAGGVMEQRQASVASSPSATASESEQQQPAAAAQPAVAASPGPIHGAAVRARRRSRLLARMAPDAATPAGPMAGEEGQTGSRSPVAAVLPLRRRRATARLSAAQEQELAVAVAAGQLTGFKGGLWLALPHDPFAILQLPTGCNSH